MTENIKEALAYAVDLARKEEKIITDKDGKEWYDANHFNLKEVEPKKYYPETIHLNTLNSLIDYLKSGLNDLANQQLIVVVNHSKEVLVYTENDEREHRVLLVKVTAIVPEFKYDYFYGLESFNIALQSRFVANEDTHRDTLIDFASKVKIEKGIDLEDDGTTQRTTVKDGAATFSKAILPNPVVLRPYRTFIEVEQPKSMFVFRMNKQAQLALFEADGGSWRLQAIQHIADYLKEHLKELNNITILA